MKTTTWLVLAAFSLAACGGSESTGETTPDNAEAARDLTNCIPDAFTDATNRVHHERVQEPELYAQEPSEVEASFAPPVDLDGDGQPERIFFEEFGTASGMHMVYLSNHGCTHFGGDFVASAYHYKVLTTRENGLFMLETFSSEGCAGLSGEVQRLKWNGTDWESAESIQCRCPEENMGTVSNPACPAPEAPEVPDAGAEDAGVADAGAPAAATGRRAR